MMGKLLIWLLVLTDNIAVGLVVPLLPYYATKLGADPVTFGYLGSLYGILQLFGNPIMGRLSDKYGRVLLLNVSFAASCISYLMVGLADSLLVLFLSRIPVGLCKQTMSISYAYISDHTTAAERAAHLGYIGTAAGLGFIIGPTAGGMLSMWDYSLPAYVSAFVFILNMVVSYLFLSDSSAYKYVWATGELVDAEVLKQRKKIGQPSNNNNHNNKNNIHNMNGGEGVHMSVNSKQAEGEASDLSIRGLFRISRNYLFFLLTTLTDPALFFLVLLEFTATMSFSTYRSSFTLINQEAFSLDATWNGFMLSYMGLISVLVQGLLVRALTHVVSEELLVKISLCGLGLALIGCAMSFSLLMLAFVLFPLILCQGLIKTCILSLITKQAPKSDTGSVIGAVGAIESLCSALGPGVGGLLMGYMGTTGPGLVGGSLSILVFLLVLVRDVSVPYGVNS